MSTSKVLDNSNKINYINFDTANSPNQQIPPLTYEVNNQGHLQIGGCDVIELIKEFGSPLYILDEHTLRTACSQYRDAFKEYYPGESQIFYASKAWSCKAVSAIVASEGFGIDVMSGGEFESALQGGLSPEKISFHGNNKSNVELNLAVESGSTIIVDNWHELHSLAEIADLAEKQNNTSIRRPIRIMLRLNPGIESNTHKYIRTGQTDSKFGFDSSQIDDIFAFLLKNSGLSCVGLHCHLGSQILDIQPYRVLADVMVDWLSRGVNYGLKLNVINVGGGLGIRYNETDTVPSIENWVKGLSEAILAACEQRKLPLPRLECEPGRSLIGNAGVTAYTLGSSKEVPGIRTYLSVDGGMSDNPRPITYQAKNHTVVANRMLGEPTEMVTIAGKHCESGDILFKDVLLPRTQPGDILVAMGTGAYNYSQSSNYNRLPRAATVLVSNGEAHLIVKRQSYQELLNYDLLPSHLTVKTEVKH